MMNNGRIFIKFLIGLKKKSDCVEKKIPPILSQRNWTSYAVTSDVTLAHLQHRYKQPHVLWLKDKHLVSHRVTEMRLTPNIYHQAVNTIRG